MPRKSDIPYIRDMARRYKLAVTIPQIVSPTLASVAMYAIARGLLRHIPDNAPVVWMLTGAAFWSDKVLNMLAVDRWQWFEAMAREAKASSVKGQAEGITAVVQGINEDGYLEGRYFKFGTAQFAPDKMQRMARAMLAKGLTERAIRSVQGCTRKDYQTLRNDLIRRGLAIKKDERKNSGVELTKPGRAVIRYIANSPTEALAIVRRSDFHKGAHARARAHG